jgi:hypothetical protein
VAGKLDAAPLRIPCPARILPYFSQFGCHGRLAAVITNSCADHGNPRPARLLREIAKRVCTKSGHPPVDWLHSIENTRVASGDFSLTKKIEGVEQ